MYSFSQKMVCWRSIFVQLHDFFIICLTAYLVFPTFHRLKDDCHKSLLLLVFTCHFWSLSLVRWELPFGHFFPIKSAECFSYDSGFSLYTSSLDHTLCSLLLITWLKLDLYFRFSCTPIVLFILWVWLILNVVSISWLVWVELVVQVFMYPWSIWSSHIVKPWQN